MSSYVYEEPAQTVDLHVSPETLLAILRQALIDWPDGVEILVRFRAIRRRPGRGMTGKVHPDQAMPRCEDR